MTHDRRGRGSMLALPARIQAARVELDACQGRARGHSQALVQRGHAALTSPATFIVAGAAGFLMAEFAHRPRAVPCPEAVPAKSTPKKRKPIALNSWVGLLMDIARLLR
jgi:hypothetical protein